MQKIKKLSVFIMFSIIIVTLSILGYRLNSPVAQRVTYIIYCSSVIITLYLLRVKYNNRLHNGILVVFTLALFVIAIKSPLLTLPLILLFPMLESGKSHYFFQFVSWLSYILFLFFFCVVILIRLMGVSVYDYSRTISPDGKQAATVVIYDQGALGGSLEVKHERNLGGLIIKSRPVYRDRLIDLEVHWINNHEIKINDVVIDVSKRRGMIDGRKK
ncbi:hypothetical protein [Alkaliphilus transvaalensis]|uniref:hypothetical protein n=1 Tax=Alkaliphilus transvaalensis TaxID=114628 RepID=UPI00047D5F1B|nr:hypothetical protein [Alkaliphilus transvaalensis]